MAEETIKSDKLIVHQEKAALYRLGMWLIDHRKAVAFVTYKITAVMLFFTFRIQMFTEFGDLLPYRHPFVQVHTRFANQFGGANNVTIMVEVKEGTIFNQETLPKNFNMTQVIDDLNDKIIAPFQDEKTTVWVAGEPRLYGWIYHYTGEVWYIFGGCTIFLWILLYMYFHDWRGALRPTLTGVMSAIWGLGVVQLI